MIGDRRAKVSDLGMAKTFEEKQSLTKVPGTREYMPPEAFDRSPKYDYKLDCFSLGVLTIQIITTRFPKPSSKDVAEKERRRKHIDLI